MVSCNKILWGYFSSVKADVDVHYIGGLGMINHSKSEADDQELCKEGRGSKHSINYYFVAKL